MELLGNWSAWARPEFRGLTRLAFTSEQDDDRPRRRCLTLVVRWLVCFDRVHISLGYGRDTRRERSVAGG